MQKRRDTIPAGKVERGERERTADLTIEGEVIRVLPLLLYVLMRLNQEAA